METTPTPVELARRIFEALGDHDIDTMQSMSHPDIVDDFVAIGEFRGRLAVRGFFEELFGAFPDFRVSVLDVVGDPDHAVVQWRANGSFTGTPFQGIHATGRSVELRGIDVMRFEDGLVKHDVVYYDGLAFARQIGLLPREGTAADKAMTAAFNASHDVWARIRHPAKAGAH